MADREPIDRPGRPNGEMPADRSPRSATPHATHDVVLLAAVADRDPDPATRDTVERMIAACGECAAIAEDLRLLAIGLADLPSEMPAPRDMRLTEADAARLRRRSQWRSILRPFGASGLPGLRPLAGALTALGLAGILFTTVPLGLPGSAASYDMGKAGGNGAVMPAPSAAPALAPTEASDAAGGPGEHAASQSPRTAGTSRPPTTDSYSQASGAPPATAVPADIPGSTSRDFGPSIPPLTIVSIILLGGGLGLIVLRLLAGRVG